MCENGTSCNILMERAPYGCLTYGPHLVYNYSKSQGSQPSSLLEKSVTRSGEETPVLRSESGITTISIYDFLLNPESLEL